MKKGGNYFLLIKYVKLNLFNIFMAFQNHAHLGNIYFDFLLLTNFPSDPNSYTQLFSDTVPFKLIHFSSVPSPEPNNWFDDESDILASDNRTSKPAVMCKLIVIYLRFRAASTDTRGM